MAVPEARDDEDLEAMFERIAAESEAERVAHEGDTEGANASSAGAVGMGGEGADTAQDDAAVVVSGPAVMAGEDLMFRRVGHLTRMLHDTLRELGYDKTLEKSASSLPDARDRLQYVATLTGQAAEKVLAAVEQGQALQQQIGGDAATLTATWDKLYAKELGIEDFKALAGQTREFLGTLSGRTEVMQGHLLTIMMAQDFHDLTGQVIKRVVDVAQTLESNLVELLLEVRSGSAEGHHDAMLNGPQVKASTDSVSNQAQVDELLESLGF